MIKLARILAIPVLIAAAALLLVLAVTAFVVGILKLAGLLGLQHALGMDTQTSHQYASVSGSMPMMVAVLGFSGVLVTAYKHLNCEESGCWRLGHRHPGHGRPVCRKHYLTHQPPQADEAS